MRLKKRKKMVYPILPQDSIQQSIPQSNQNDYGDPLANGGGLFNSNKQAYVDSVLNANKNIEWVQRLRQPNTPSIQIQGEPYKSTHLMGDNGQGYVFPHINMEQGKLQYIANEDSAEDYARQHNTGIQLPQKEGTWFSNNGYKQGTNILKKEQGGIYNKPNYQINTSKLLDNEDNIIPGVIEDGFIGKENIGDNRGIIPSNLNIVEPYDSTKEQRDTLYRTRTSSSGRKFQYKKYN